MSRHQCCVWGCHNRKGSCAEGTNCGCPELLAEHCPQPEILTLHVISSMPEPVKRAVVTKIYKRPSDYSISSAPNKRRIAQHAASVAPELSLQTNQGIIHSSEYCTQTMHYTVEAKILCTL